ncbi:hypothetical protein Avbf_12353 [Armadillidium vulgare]|nr:hypothetical protein Avbf_12353 [Armadillidium vulgare]
MKILGVSKIFFYKTKCHKNVEKILDFYENEGIVQLTTFYFPPPYDQEGTFIRLWSKTKKSSYRAAQNIYITDCLQRNKDDFDYLAVFDPDEIPILRHHRSLPELLKSLRKSIKNETYITSTKKRHVFKGKAYMGHFSEHICVKKENCFEGNIEEETALLPIREKVVQKMNKVLSVLEFLLDN